MVEQRVERKLAAILAADIVGYSRLMEADEEGTHARLRVLRRQFIYPAVAAHRGRIVKTTGDGALTEFASVVDAVRCAVELQRGMVARNAVVPQDRRIVFRMGVNLGDVIVEEDDIYGDGVNIAARLEALAEPGGLLVSGTVYDHIREKVPYAFTDKGAQTVKNISQAVRVYALGADAVAALPEAPASIGTSRLVGLSNSRRLWLAATGLAAAVALAAGVWFAVKPSGSPQLSDAARRLSIVVLPFANLSNDPEQDYFADGVTDSLITDLSRGLPGTFVIARTTAFTYKGKAVDVTQVGRELTVRYVLEGSILRSGEKLRVNAQLIDAQTGAHLWAEHFDKDRVDLLTMQDEIVTRIARTVGLQVIDEEARRAARKDRAVNPNATDLAMRGWALRNRAISRETNIAALGMFQDALRIDDQNVDALVGVAAVNTSDAVAGFYEKGNEERLRLADETLARALAVDPNNVRADGVRCLLRRTQQRFEEAIRACETAIAANPADPLPYQQIGYVRIFLGQPEQSLAWFEQADRLGPHDPQRWAWLCGIGAAHFLLGHDAQAVDWLSKAAEADPAFGITFAWLAAAHVQLGQAAPAQEALRNFLRLNPGFTVKKLIAVQPSSNPAFLAQVERLSDGLRKAGLPEE